MKSFITVLLSFAVGTSAVDLEYIPCLRSLYNNPAISHVGGSAEMVPAYIPPISTIST